MRRSRNRSEVSALVIDWARSEGQVLKAAGDRPDPARARLMASAGAASFMTWGRYFRGLHPTKEHAVAEEGTGGSVNAN